jgi:hypothetical protein
MGEFSGLTDQATETRAPFAVVGRIAVGAKFDLSADAIAPNRALAAAPRPIGHVESAIDLLPCTAKRSGSAPTRLVSVRRLMLF